MPRKKKPPTDCRDTIADLILAGLRRNQIAKYLGDNIENPPKGKALEQQIDAAAAELAARAQEWGDDLAAVVGTQRLNDLYARCLRIQDYKTCLAIQREINRRLEAGPAAAPPEPAEQPQPETTPTGRPKLTLVQDAYRSAMGGQAG